MKLRLYLFLSFVFVFKFIFAQYTIEGNNGQVILTCNATFADKNGDYSYNANQSIILGSNDTVNTHLNVVFTSFDIHPSDTLYVYDGITTYSPLIGKFNNSSPVSLINNRIQSSAGNTTGKLLFVFKSDYLNNGEGWESEIFCVKPCQKIVTELDTLMTMPRPEGKVNLNICPDENVNIVSNIQFPQNNLLYHQTLQNCTFEWNSEDGVIFNTPNFNHNYPQSGGYELSLKVIDSVGCEFVFKRIAFVRVASNPSMIIRDSLKKCFYHNIPVSVKAGNAQDSDIKLNPYSFTDNILLQNDTDYFVPDGPNCTSQCLSSSIYVNDYSPTQTIQNSNQIESICINMEHSYAGDLGFKITCPNGQTVVLDPNSHSGGACLGEPFGGSNHSSSDNGCDPVNNPPGIGWTYCWSELYTTVVSQTLDQLSNSVSGIIDSTNQVLHTSYIKPVNPLLGLVGCPYNGIWILQICDDYSADNGYLFNWSLNFKLQSVQNLPDWTFQVAIDSVTFNGANIMGHNDSIAMILPSGQGVFPYVFTVHDSFGCTWDSIIHIDFLQGPSVNLGSDTSLCSGGSLLLNAGNPGMKYLWMPNGDTTQTIAANTSNFESIAVYWVEVKNESEGINCLAYDSISITIHEKPNISFLFTPSMQPVYGCEPVNVSIVDESTPELGIVEWKWNFGDNTPVSTVKNPFHTYYADSGSTGMYSLTVYMKTIYGCESSQNITPFAIVNPMPFADFTYTFNVPLQQWNFISLASGYDSVSWNFCDGTTSSQINPVHSFNGAPPYPVTLIAYKGNCIDSIHRDVDWATIGINDSSLDQLIIYPNPAQTHVYINTNILKDGELTIFDYSGKNVCQTVLSKEKLQKIDLSFLTKGIYVVFIKYADNQFIRKLLIR